ncbi:1-aminocyclopropane-1-carboxylate oxidase [Cyberlindnera fabianii]|uniref:1-aminocyclopropane-1-carboxylate oxidase n=1 Tax=Cyberlindnera fabianii TaxID=36022 RepID=A0A1V2L6I6_CYBFA|nr:1-aminocyclopropane-1-carboxylate oxidase [Cyberlindnera fabianii]
MKDTVTSGPDLAPLKLVLENGNEIQLSTSEVGALHEEDFDSIPILDLSDLNSPSLSQRTALANELKSAASTVGFFYIKNHQIPLDIVDGAFEMSKRFFALSEDEKMKIWTGFFPEGQYTGYHPMGRYNRAGNKFNDLYEAFNMSYDPQFDPLPPPEEKAKGCYNNIWPELIPEMKQTMMKYQNEWLTLGRKILDLTAISLGLPEDYFQGACEAPSGGLRIIHYPIQEHAVSEQNGIGPHTDFQTLTFVNPGEVSGLQVINKRGQWIEVPPLKNHLIVNVADCLQRITNDELVSTVHRVVNNKAGRDRFSIAYFFGFDNDYLLKPIPGAVTDERPQKYKDIVTSKDYYAWRAKMAKSGQNLKLKP